MPDSSEGETTPQENGPLSHQVINEWQPLSLIASAWSGMDEEVLEALPDEQVRAGVPEMVSYEEFMGEMAPLYIPMTDPDLITQYDQLVAEYNADRESIIANRDHEKLTSYWERVQDLTPGQ